MHNCDFVLSIDTEEEWDWSGPFPDTRVSVENVQQVPAFQARLASLGIQPTYFLDYAVIENTASRETLQQMLADFPDIELGTHLHPWVTPPKAPALSEEKSHIVNLPLQQVNEQIQTLTTAIRQHFKVQPVSFRSGRWGVSDGILSRLIDQGYRVDSSVYPFYRNPWFNYDDTDSQPGWLVPNAQQPEQRIFELPVTVGFNRKHYAAASRLHNRLEQKPWRYARPIGLLWQTNLLKKIYLSPELSSAEDMIQLCKTALANQYPVIHMYLHSSSLLPGMSTYVKTSRDKLDLIDRIETVLNYLARHSHLSMHTVNAAAQRLSATGNKEDR